MMQSSSHFFFCYGINSYSRRYYLRQQPIFFKSSAQLR